MNNRLISAFKYFILALAAFVVPKMIVDSGRIVAPLDPDETESRESAEQGDKRSIWPFVGFKRTPPDVSSATRDAARRAPTEPANVSLGAGAAFGVEKRGAVAAPTPGAFSDSPIDGEPFANEFFDADASDNPFLSERAAVFSTTRKTLDELFRFGHSPDWFVDNWARVDAAPSDDGLLGYRVAVSTGPGVDDLTGALTCYFDATSERRVVFSGQTGDYRKALRFLEREYGLALAPDSTAARLRYESTLTTARADAPPSRMIVRPTRVFLRGAEKSFFNVDVVLERPYN